MSTDDEIVEAVRAHRERLVRMREGKRNPITYLDLRGGDTMAQFGLDSGVGLNPEDAYWGDQRDDDLGED